jgi:serine/threonine protein phosphatase 1
MGLFSRFMGRESGGAEQAQHPDATVGASTARVGRYKRNTLGRDFVVADIHGAFDLLLIAMAEIDFDPAVDRIFSTGDLIDRGDSSERSAEFIALPYFHSTLGNHEAMLLELYEHGDPPQNVLNYAARKNGFEWWLKVPEDQRREIVAAVATLPHVIEVESARGIVGILHADAPRDMRWDEFIHGIEKGDDFVIRSCLWGRERVDQHDMHGIQGIARVYVGHTPQWQGMRRFGNVYALDTGAAFRLRGDMDMGRFTMVRLDADESQLADNRYAVGMMDIRTGH